MKTLPTNPFTDAYWKAELKAYGLSKRRYHVEHLSVDWAKIHGRCDDYLNSNMRFENTPMPRLTINGHLWMSLTPMEIQSAALAIHRATGHVITGGLGLGYFALRAAAKPEVTQVTVFEKEPLVIAWFLRMFKSRPELAKINLVEGDMRKLCAGYAADFAFVDIYQTMLADEVISDARLFRRHNRINRYHYWGVEKVVLELMLQKMLPYGNLLIGEDLFSYFRFWMHTPYDDDGVTLSQLHRSVLDDAFLKRARRVLTDFPV